MDNLTFFGIESNSGIKERVVAAVAVIQEATKLFPHTIYKLQNATGIVSYTGLKLAITSSFVEEKDYLWIDELMWLSDSTYNMLLLSLRSQKGIDTRLVPSNISVESTEYFAVRNTVANSRLGHRSINSELSHPKFQEFRKPKKPCDCHGEITQLERAWVKWLREVKGVTTKKEVLSQVWSVKSHRNKNYEAAMDRLKIINKEEGLGFKWRK